MNNLSQWAKPRGLKGHLVGRSMTRHHAGLIQWSLELLAIQATDRVLDVGCGGGDALRRMAGIATDGFVAGVDHSLVMVHQATLRNLKAIAMGRVKVKRGDVKALPWPAQSFDKVCAIETLQFWNNPLEGLVEIHRVLQPEGQVYVVVAWSQDGSSPEARERAQALGMTLYSRHELHALLSEAQFREIEITLQNNWLALLGSK